MDMTASKQIGSSSCWMLVFCFVLLIRAGVANVDLKGGSQICCNTVTYFVCVVTESSFITWNAEPNITVSFLSTNPPNSPIHRGENEIFEFTLMGAKRNSNDTQFFDFRSRANVTATRAVIGTFLECTDGISPETVEILSNSSREDVITVTSSSCECEMGTATVSLEWSLTSNICGWDDDAVEYNIVMKSLNSTAFVTQSSNSVSPHQMILGNGNHTIELTATNACGETSNPESLSAFIDCGSNVCEIGGRPIQMCKSGDVTCNKATQIAVIVCSGVAVIAVIAVIASYKYIRRCKKL